MGRGANLGPSLACLDKCSAPVVFVSTAGDHKGSSWGICPQLSGPAPVASPDSCARSLRLDLCPPLSGLFYSVWPRPAPTTTRYSTRDHHWGCAGGCLFARTTMTSKVSQAAEGLSALTKAGVGVSAAGGVWAWIGENSAEIGAVAAVAGASCALIGVLYSIIMDQRDRRRRDYYRGEDQ